MKPNTTPPSVELIRSALSALSPEGYDNWLRVGMGLHAWSPTLGLAEWVEWSRRGSTFKPGECERKWASFGEGGVSVGTVIGLAKAAGWKWSGPRSTPYTGAARPIRTPRGKIRGVSVSEMFGAAPARPVGAPRPVSFAELAD